MAISDRTARAGVYLERLLENQYVQERLSDGVESLRRAYRRASKRRVEPTRDEKVRRQIRQAALSLTEAAGALKTGREKPKRRRGRRAVIILGLVALGAAAAFAWKRDLGSKAPSGSAPAHDPTPTAQTAPVA
jgi:hypothetical protein